MSLPLILSLAGIQFVIQYVAWDIFKDSTKSLLDRINKMFNKQVADKAGSIIIIAENIGISLLVLAFTAAGTIAGITNLFASAILGVVMFWQMGKLSMPVSVCELIDKIKMSLKGDEMYAAYN